MPKTITTYTTVSGTIGGEAIRVSKLANLTTGDAMVSQTVVVPDDNTTVTLWNAAQSPITAFSMCVIDVDPDNAYLDNAAAAKLEIEFQGSGATAVAFRVRREAPLILTTDDIGADVDSINQIIDRIVAKNTNADGIGDVAVRVILIA
jgi:hypothetical protein